MTDLGYDTCPCGLCGKPTPMTATKRCDACWELERRVLAQPELAWKILAAVTPAAPSDAADARRYRVIRDSPFLSDGVMLRKTSDGPVYRRGTDLDSAVDALSQTMQPQAGAASAKSVSDMLLEAGAIWGGIRGKWSATPAQINAFVEILNRATSQAEPAAGEQAGAVASEYDNPTCDEEMERRSRKYWAEFDSLAAPGAAIAAREQEGDWQIDHSAGRPVLTCKNCSVIEAEDAEYVMRLIAADRVSRNGAPDTPQAKEPKP